MSFLILKRKIAILSFHEKVNLNHSIHRLHKNYTSAYTSRGSEFSSNWENVLVSLMTIMTIPPQTVVYKTNDLIQS